MFLNILHVKRQLHFLLSSAEVNCCKAIHEGLLDNEGVVHVIERAPETVVNDSWQLGVLEKGHIVDHGVTLLTLAGTHASHRNVIEYISEVRLNHFSQEALVSMRVKVLYQK